MDDQNSEDGSVSEILTDDLSVEIITESEEEREDT